MCGMYSALHIPKNRSLKFRHRSTLLVFRMQFCFIFISDEALSCGNIKQGRLFCAYSSLAETVTDTSIILCIV